MKEMYKLLFGFIICVLTGIAIGYFYLTYQPTLAHWFLFKPSLYNTSNSSLQTKFEALGAVSVEWSQLLPDSEKRVLKKYQQTPKRPSRLDLHLVVTQNFLGPRIIDLQQRSGRDDLEWAHRRPAANRKSDRQTEKSNAHLFPTALSPNILA